MERPIPCTAFASIDSEVISPQRRVDEIDHVLQTCSLSAHRTAQAVA